MQNTENLQNTASAAVLQRWDTSYEWKAVTVLGLGFGLVGLDRWIIAPLFPFIMKDLHLGYQDLGSIVGILGISWGISATVMGGISDRIGRRKVLIPAIFLFSILSIFSGLASGLITLLIIRSIMGIAEGSYCPTSFATTNDASEPKRRGLNIGMQGSTFGLFGLGFGPIIATQLMRVVPSWRWVFLVVAIPGLILGAFMFWIIREPSRDMADKRDTADKPAMSLAWFKIFQHRNIGLSMAALFCAMTGVFVLSAMVPNYLVDYLHLTAGQMGFVTSGLGFGGFVGSFVIPGLSDLLGRRLVAVLSFVSAALVLWAFIRTGASPGVLFGLLFVTSLFTLGVVSMLSGPIAAEAAPAGLVSSSIGIVVGSGEIFGGIAQGIAGFLAQHFGIQSTLLLAMAGIVSGVIVCLFLKETAPKKLARSVPVALAG